MSMETLARAKLEFHTPGEASIWDSNSN